ncbi:MAG: nucleotidyl transferase AbiEii/AbiGii toxin family protein [bacterium]
MFEKLLEKAARGLARARIPYMVIGGQAVLRYGEPRLTKDIDLTLGVGPAEMDRVLRMVKNMGLRVAVNRALEFVRRTLVLPCIDENSGIRVDFIFSTTLYERQAIERAQLVRLGKTMVKFASLEDLVIHKMVAGRPRDLDDVKAVLIKNPKRDSAYILRWLRSFDRSLQMDTVARFQKIVRQVRRLGRESNSAVK